ESDKLIFTAQMGFQIQLQREAIQPRDFDFLMRLPTTPYVQSPVDFLTNYSCQSYKETSREIAVFFIPSPGVDPLKDVESLGKQIGFTIDNGKFHNVSLGQGQEVMVENALEVAGREGHLVILQNIHLVARWLPTLEKK
ncbi:unnamed protein product, partial [Allacma fusca]